MEECREFGDKSIGLEEIVEGRVRGRETEWFRKVEMRKGGLLGTRK